ncbi:MAG: alpha-E domain-containing protein [bacterium]
MLHDQALDLLWLGVLLERAGQVARAIDVHHLASSRPRSGRGP